MATVSPFNGQPMSSDYCKPDFYGYLVRWLVVVWVSVTLETKCFDVAGEVLWTQLSDQVLRSARHHFVVLRRPQPQRTEGGIFA